MKKSFIGAKLLALLTHNIPALVLGASLVIAWLWELVGGALFICLFLASCFLLRPFPGYPPARRRKDLNRFPAGAAYRSVLFSPRMV